MKRYKFSDLLLYEEKIKKFYQKYGLGFNLSNRIARYFKYLKEIEEGRKLDSQSFGKILQKDKAKYYYSQFYVLEICNIINSLENLPQDEKIIKEKLIDLAKGTYLLSEENPNNTKARDTAFELSLFSFLQARDLNVKVCAPNPDLELKSEKFTYSIECKRPQSAKTLEKNIKKAIKQLRKSTSINVIPTIALSLEQVILGNDLILDSRDERSASRFLSTTLELFLRTNLKMIQKVCGDQSCLVLYYLSCLAGFQTNIPMANATFITGNIYNFENGLSNSIDEDLNVMIPQSSL